MAASGPLDNGQIGTRYEFDCVLTRCESELRGRTPAGPGHAAAYPDTRSEH
jgi:hypothetical protein